MRRKLEEPIVSILKSRVFISRTTGLIRIADVVRGFEVSHMTLYRYDNPRHRRRSVEDARRQTTRRQSLPEMKLLPYERHCYKCKEKVVQHAKCQACQVLIHGEHVLAGNCGTHYCIRYIALRAAPLIPSTYGETFSQPA